VPGIRVAQLPGLESRVPQNTVTNIVSVFSEHSSRLTLVSTSDGGSSSEAMPLISVLVTAMNSAAGTPLSETSPTVKKRWSSSTKK